MFSLRVHSVDPPQPLLSGFTTTNAATSNSDPHPSPNLHERRGIVHLFRHLSTAVQSCRDTLLFVVAVPNYVSGEDFIRFCGSYIDHISDLTIIRNDATEDRYSVLVKFVNQLKADGFYWNFNGKWFSSTEAEVCHILYTLPVEYTEFAEIAGTPPTGFTELPTCPVCLERLDQDTSGILSAACDHSFQCSCITKWTYLSCQVCRLCQQHDEKPTCSICGTSENLWVCVICGFIGCGRYKEGHGIRHWKDTQHCYSLDLETQRVWDYVGDSYVHRLNHSKADGKLVTKHKAVDEDLGGYPYSEDSGISGALFSSKVEAVADEYNRLLATQLEAQRQYYESLLVEAKAKRGSSIAEAVEKAVISKTQDIQDKLEKCVQETKSVAEINQNLLKDQKVWQQKLKEIEEREILLLKSRDESILDLEEQIRDLTVYIEAQKTLDTMADSDGVRGGTVLLPSTPSSTTNTKKHSKSSRRRN